MAACWLRAAVAQEAPSAEEQAALIAETRARALAYNKKLPDFLCTQITRRSSAPVVRGADPAWKLLDTLTIRLSYFNQKEDYRVVRINDKPANRNLAGIGGWTTQGDFGSMLQSVFEEKSEAQFAWQRWYTWNGRRTAVLTWHIERPHSQFVSNSHYLFKTSHVNWAASGLVQVDAETRQVLHLTIDSVDMPRESPTQEVHLVLDYAFQKIGDSDYLLPAHSLTTIVVKQGKMAEKSDSEFTEYRKFATDTRIQFGSDEAK